MKRSSKLKAQSSKREKEKIHPETQKGILIICLVAIAILEILSLFNLAGNFGIYFDQLLDELFGYGKYLTPVILLGLSYFLLYPEKYPIRTLNWIGLSLFILSFFAIFELWQHGGYLGLVLKYPLFRLSGFWASLVILLAVFFSSFLLMFNTSLQAMRDFFARLWERIRSVFRRTKSSFEVELEEPQSVAPFKTTEISKEVAKQKLEQLQLIPELGKSRIKRKIAIPLDLLTEQTGKPTSGDINLNKEKIRKTLENFGIEVEMGDVSIGPTVTQYTLKPAEGVKLSQITTLQNDLALSLAAHPIRIEAPIPGKSLVGVEVPNQAVAIVGLRGILESETFKNRRNNLTLALGRDVAGAPYFVDLDPLPHLLIAGATGSGKSVCINSIIVSLLYQNSPDDLKLILIDPKRVEFPIYNGTPHLLTPVITEVDKTINALKWTVAEMDRRYEQLSRSGKRNIQLYNASGGEMPYLIVIVDELADLMATAANEVEAAITRLAQMARAVGIHLVLATQRPSVDVITGLIKANITARAAFNVASIIDSRTILDHGGAEKLLGRGDMLFISAQLSKPKRLQGAYLSEKEIENVVGFLKKNAAPEYVEEVTAKQFMQSLPSTFAEEELTDELVEDAKEVIKQAGKASASLLQRRLRVGYARAARILDILEEEGFIGPAQGAKPREILQDNNV